MFQWPTFNMNTQASTLSPEPPPLTSTPLSVFTVPPLPVQDNVHSSLDKQSFTSDRASVSSRQTCVFFQKGTCRNGLACTFLHEEATTQPAAITSHPSSRMSASTLSTDDLRLKTVCRFFLAGACLKGEGCKFLHDPKLAPSTSQVVAEGDTTFNFAPVPERQFLGLNDKPGDKNSSSTAFQSATMNPFATVTRPQTNAALREFSEVDDTLTVNERARRFKSAEPQPAIDSSSIAFDDSRQDDEDEPEFASGSACIVGSLMSMCSESEIERRDLQMDVHVLESVQDDTCKSRTTRRADPGKMVKKYQRSAAGTALALPSEVRPPMVLAKTVLYLFENVMESDLVPVLDIYNFLRDRFRSIRKDFALQDQAPTLAIAAHEQIARYFILSNHELCEEKEDDFQKFQNLQQIAHTITSLNHYYKDLRLRGGIATPNEAEFYSYQILLNMRDANKLNDQLMNLPVHLRTSAPIRVARELSASFRGKNYARFFRILRKRATYLQRCCVHGFLWGFRSKALSIIFSGMGPVSATFPLRSLLDILAFDDLSETIHFCETHGLSISDEEIVKTQAVLNFNAKMEWSKSRVLIGTPPSRISLVLGPDPGELQREIMSISKMIPESQVGPSSAMLTSLKSNPALTSSAAAADHQAVVRQQEFDRLREQETLMMRRSFEAEQKRKAVEEARLRQENLVMIENNFISRKSKVHRQRCFRFWVESVRRLSTAREQNFRKKQIRDAQRKFCDQKLALSALSKLARLYFLHQWLHRWRFKLESRRQSFALSMLFYKHTFLEKWVRAVRVSKQSKKRQTYFRKLISRLPEPHILPPIAASTCSGQKQDNSTGWFLENMFSVLSSSKVRKVFFHNTISLPDLDQGSDCNGTVSVHRVAHFVSRMFSVHRKSSNVFTSSASNHPDVSILFSRSTHFAYDRCTQAVCFVVTNPSNDRTRLHHLLESVYDPQKVALLIIYINDAGKYVSESGLLKALDIQDHPEHLRLVLPVCEFSEFVSDMVQAALWQASAFVKQPQHFDTVSYVIQSRAKEIFRLALPPNRSIKMFNTMLSVISKSLLQSRPWPPLWSATKLSPAHSERVEVAQEIIAGHALPEFEDSACVDCFNGQIVPSYLDYPSRVFSKVVDSTPVRSLMWYSHCQGMPSYAVFAIVIICQMETLLGHLCSRGVDDLACFNVPPFVAEFDSQALVVVPRSSKGPNPKRRRKSLNVLQLSDVRQRMVSNKALFNSRVENILENLMKP